MGSGQGWRKSDTEVILYNLFFMLGADDRTKRLRGQDANRRFTKNNG